MNAISQNNQFSLNEIKRHYNIFFSHKGNDKLKNIFSKFSYQFLSDEIDIGLLLQEFVQKYKFFTFILYNSKKEKFKNLVIISEKKCLIIENINTDFVLSILKKSNGYYIDLNSIDSADDLKDEILNFCLYFQSQININKFVKFTIYPITAFIIRRFYCPTNFFEDKSFFSFYSNELNSSNNLSTMLYSSSKEICQNICNDEKNIRKINYENFQENEFIILKLIYSNTASFYLVIHIEKLYLFLYKKIDYTNKNLFLHEIDFCKTINHRCLMRFYGFVEQNKEINGFIYEYMPNGTLSDFMSKNNVSNLFKITSIIRIFEGIKYLHSRSFVHRDIKSINILVDHDNKCYIADFDKCKKIDTSSQNQMTLDFASGFYASPEQLIGEDIHGNQVSFPTDIFSFGLVIYFICENKDFIDTIDIDQFIKILENKNIHEIPNCHSNIEKLFQKCISIDPNERPAIKNISEILYGIVNSFYYLDQYFLVEKNLNENFDELILYFNETLYIFNENLDYDDFYQKITNFSEILKSLSNSKISQILYNIGYYNEKINDVKHYFKAKKYYETSEKFNNSSAQLRLGTLYYKGHGVEKNIKKAIEYYEKSAKQNNPDSLYFLGYLYFYGDGIEINYDIARKYFELSAKFNNNDALYCLGNIYFYGLGVDIDYEKAKIYYELSAKFNNSNAIYRLGQIYHDGILGVEKDYSKAKYYFKLAAKQNNPTAIYYLGVLYFKGDGIKKNINKAIHYFEIAANQNFSEAQNFLGELYCNGIYFDKNYFNAKKYFKLAAKQNNSNALYNLGNLYMKGLGVKKNYKKAREYIQLSAKRNNSNALNSLGYMYYKGIGVEFDYEKAKEYFLKSSKLNNDLALCNLGDCYCNGFYEPFDFDRAKYYFKLSAKQNNSEALFFLGKMYYDGKRQKQNFIKAKKYFELSAKLNNSNAIFYLGKLYFKGNGVKQDFKKSKECFLTASLFQNPEAIFYIGIIYYEGLDIEKNYIKAYEYFLSSANKNNLNALFYLGLMHENEQGVVRDLTKVIEFYSQCCLKQTINYNYEYNNGFYEQTIKNYCYFLSYNNLGLIYAIYKEKKDLEKAMYYLKVAGCNEYTYAQNNLGIYYQYYLNEKANADHFYGKASKNRFDMTEFIIGHNYELENNIKESINHYKKALEYQNEPLYYKNYIIKDKQLEISRSFINCYANLKMFNYSGLDFENENIQKYFINSIFRPIFTLLFHSDFHSYEFTFDQDDKTSLNNFFMHFPLFNASNNKINSKWKELNSDLENKIKKVIIIKYNLSKKNCNTETTKIQHDKINNLIKDAFISLNNKDFKLIKEKSNECKFCNGNNNINELRFLSEKNQMENILIYQDFLCGIKCYKKEIPKIINNMDKILFNPPYSVLFGRIPSYTYNTQRNVDISFYQGFGIL